MIGFKYFQEIKNREVKRQENPPGQAAQTARPEKGPLFGQLLGKFELTFIQSQP